MKEVEKSTKEQSKESLKVEKPESGCQNSGNEDGSLKARISPKKETGSSVDEKLALKSSDSSFLNLNKKELEKELYAYSYDRQIAHSTLEHRQGYISEQMYGICSRTIKECDKQIKLIKEALNRETGNE